ncbi:hypothetical protein DSM01_2032 [Leeuwenhoekiella palythoae]|uniref:Uncharacterized protein n=1 Tax=Leeuwenhoekiella palythoae TaxID=573501 RepID=A0ABY0D1W8_9FLAO|nr:hypothetical protein DSM01_2032 [Leeuwenhoekiella palythoae]
MMERFTFSFKETKISALLVVKSFHLNKNNLTKSVFLTL